ncbi:MAG: SIR2 family protein [Bacteroidia bacterium]|nr:SIR2 family protein [Bacteroidia bacterium]
MYTLNYDKIFKVLSEKAGIKVFEGFECDEFVSENGVLPNIGRILSDFDSNIHYNLHGSAFWEVNPREKNSQLYNQWISLQPFPVLDINNNESAIVQIEKGKNILISNIITGFLKAQKSFITPFKQMQSAFDKDCFFANELIVIGYSFGDSHINASIKTALKYNPELNLHFIDPAYCEKDKKNGYDLLVKRLIYIFPEILNYERTQPKYSADNDTCIYFNNRLVVTAIGFDEYLNRSNSHSSAKVVSE